MGTEVLRPQDCLVERIRSPPNVFPPRRRSNSYYYYYNNNPGYVNNYQFAPRPNRKQPVRPDHQRRQQPPRQSEAMFSKRSSSADDLKYSKNRSVAGDQFAVEKVAIFRRGESLDSKIKSNKKESSDGLIVFANGTDRLGPENSGMVPKQIRMASPAAGNPDVLYAGSAFAVSPAPSSLPLPSFSKTMKNKQVSVDDSATRDLRRLLRLDL